MAGEPVRDTARLTGATSNARGTVYYRYYTSLGSCLADTAAWTGSQPLHGISAGYVTVFNGHVPGSRFVRIGKPGKYYWVAFYTGDTSNSAAVSNCKSEVLLVKPYPKPYVITKLSKYQVQAGWPVRDTAVVIGGSGEGSGYLQYRYYSRLGDCESDASRWPFKAPMHGYSAGLVRVFRGIAGPSDSVWFRQPGVYYWAAFYAGKTFSQSAVSNCKSEVLWVKPWLAERPQDRHVAVAAQAAGAILQRRTGPGGSPSVGQRVVPPARDLLLDSALLRLGQGPSRSEQLPAGGYQAV
jgi:hypothetical protein